MKERILNFSAAGLGILTVLAFVSVLNAASWTEVGDAGDLPGSANFTVGIGPLTSIIGSVSSNADEDMYKIFITDPAGFSAQTVAPGAAAFDTQLFLFDAAGFGVYANDDFPGGSPFHSRLPAGNPSSPTTPGIYYLAISEFNNDPTSPGGLIFPSSPFAGVFGPTGPGGGSAISGWTSGSTSFGGGSYTIALTGATFAVIPEPSTLLLFGVGLMGLGIAARRKRTKA